MNYNLTDCIVNHVFDNLGLTLNTKLSLKSDEFLLNQVIEFFDEHGNDKFAKIYGSQIEVESSLFKIMVVDFSDNDMEYYLIVKLENCPSYACYLAIDELTNIPYNGLICFSLKPNNWLKTNISIQATFLAGMENLKDINGVWSQITKYDDLLEEIKSFLQFQENFESEV